MNRLGRTGLLARIMVLVLLFASMAWRNEDTWAQTEPPPNRQDVEQEGFGGLISDGQFVYGPNAIDFDMEAFLRSYDSPLVEQLQVLRDWSMYASVNPRVLLTLIEMRSGLVTGGEGLDLDDPFGYPGLDFEEEIEKLTVDMALDFYTHLYKYGARSEGDAPSSQGFFALPLSDGGEIQLPSNMGSGSVAVLQRLANIPSRRDAQAVAAESLASEFSSTYGTLFPGDDPLDDSNVINPTSPPPATLFQFPFPLGSSWWFSGAHSWNGGGYGPPYSSMDFGTTGNTCESPPSHLWAVAAAWGIGYHPYGYSCWYRISHGDGWETSYYHLLNVRGDGGVNQNDPVGSIACETCAGGFATGPHLHFSLLYNGAYFDLQGVQLSGWTIDAGDGSYDGGYIERDGVRLFPYNAVYNDGIPGEIICPRSGSVILYRNDGFDCAGQGEGVGYIIPDASGWQNLPASFDNHTTSINIPTGWSVRLFEDPFRKGASICVSSDDESFIGDTFEGGIVPLNNAVSSVEVFEDTECLTDSADVVALYEHPGQWGAQSAWEGEGLFNLPAYLDNLTSSLWITENWSAAGYRDFNGAGQAKCFRASDSDFSNDTFGDGQPVDNSISSIAIFNRPSCAGFQQSPADFSGDGRTEISVFRPANGRWYISGQSPFTWGIPGDIPVPADYDGDGRMDAAVFRPANGRWYIPEQPPRIFGQAGDVPLPCDYDGDGDADLGLFRPTNGRWYVFGSPSKAFGLSSDIPIPADFDRDGACEIAVFRPSNGRWYIMGQPAFTWGRLGDVPLPGDYDGDGNWDPVVFRPANGRWYILGEASFEWGIGGDIPVPGDYDGDGDYEVAVFRPTNGFWYVRNQFEVPFGINGDFPLPARDSNGDGVPY